MVVKANRFAVFSAVAAALRGARNGGPGLGERLHAIPRMVSATLRGRYRGMGVGRLVSLALGLVYVVSPIDLLPEIVLPLIGLGDDLVVLTFVVSGLLVETEQFLAWEREQEVLHRRGQGTVVSGEVVDDRRSRRR
jgi:uncharacterized membrane protein YkvA (DUF1232 family)